jgi:hypothetical protein
MLTYKLHYQDKESIIIEANNMREIREKVFDEIYRRKWLATDCCLEEIE